MEKIEEMSFKELVKLLSDKFKREYYSDKAIDNPLTETQIDGTKGVIFNIMGSEELSLNEINNAIQIISERVDSEANIIFGTVIDKSLEDEVKVTVIATGVDTNK